jgi:ATP-dependent DNA ligase
MALRDVPAHKYVALGPGLPPLMVDAFQPRHADRAPADALWLLTHAHADHYGGLSERWERGPILCSVLTARLLARVVPGLPVHWLRPLGLGGPHRVAVPGAAGKFLEVTLVDANHCPGAAVFLLALPDGRCVVHTGDFRWHDAAMTACPRWSSFRGCDELYLDTTYCAPRHAFPEQEAAVARVTAAVAAMAAEDAAADAAAAAAAGGAAPPRGAAPHRRLYLIATYTVGKERILAAAARAAGLLVYAPQRRLGVLRCVPEMEGLLTGDPAATPLHAVGMELAGESWPFPRPNFVVPAEYAAAHAAAHGGAPGGAPGTPPAAEVFWPTGWLHTKPGEDAFPPPRDKAGSSVRVHLVPYSEHSSHSELLLCVRFLRPARVVPTVVGAGGERDVERLLRHFSGLVDATAGKARFLSAMWRGGGAAAAAAAALPQADGEADEEAVAAEGEGEAERASGEAAETDVVDLADDEEEEAAPPPAPAPAAAAADNDEAGPSGSAAASVDAGVAQLLAVAGGALDAARAAALLRRAGGDVARAVNAYLDGPPGGGAMSSATKRPPPAPASRTPAKQRRGGGAAAPPGQLSMRAFLSPKKSPPPDKGRRRLAEPPQPAPPPPPPAAPLPPAAPDAPPPSPLPPPFADRAALAPRDAVALPPAEYDPVLHAPWAAGEPVPYLHLARAFEAADGAAKRLRIGDALTNAFRSVLALGGAEDVAAFAYLALGKVAPDHAGLELGVGCATAAAALAEATGVSRGALREMLARLGDLGDVAAACKRGQATLARPAPLTVRGVLATLRGLAAERGAGAGARRQRAVLGLLRAAREGEARYLVRTLVGNLRVGAGWRSVVPAIARAVAMHQHQQAAAAAAGNGGDAAGAGAVQTLPPKAALDAAAAAATTAFQVCPDLALFAGALLAGPAAGVAARLPPRAGTPIRSMLAKPAAGAAAALAQLRGVPFLAERKYDGVRAQVHVLLPDEGGGGLDVGVAARVRVFSRNGEDRTAAFPDVAAAVAAALGAGGGAARSLIFDAELVAVERGGGVGGEARLRPFQDLARRARGAVALADVAVDTCVFAFDLLALGGASLLARPLRERRAALAAALPAREAGRVELAHARVVEDVAAEAAAAALEEEEKAVAEEGAPVEAGAPAAAAAGGEEPSASAAAAPVPPPAPALEARLLRWLREAVAAGTEGLMLKSLDGPYEPSRRADAWVKLKKDYLAGADSLDLIPIGAWHGSGRKTGWLSPILLAVYDPETEELQSLCRCMSGFSDVFYRVATARLREAEIPGPRLDYRTGERPDVWLDAREVWEIRGADVSVSPVHHAAFGRVATERGLGLRFPRFLRLRPDKEVEEASGPGTVAAMFAAQARPGGARGAAAGEEEGEKEAVEGEEEVVGGA